MTKLELPNITLVMIETLVHKLAALTVQDCLDKVEFGEVLIFSDVAWDTPGRTYKVHGFNKIGWETFRWYEAPKYITTSHGLFVEWDAGIFDPTMWKDEYLEYDYIGAPWPPNWHTDKFNDRNVGNGGFSLRSKRLLDYLYEHRADFPVTTDVGDALFCWVYRPRLEQAGFKWAPAELALDFAFEIVRRSEHSRHFGYHNVMNWPLVLSPDALKERMDIAKTNEYIIKKELLTPNHFPNLYPRGYDANGHWRLQQDDGGWFVRAYDVNNKTVGEFVYATSNKWMLA
jgi:hypothetical protein